MHAPGPICACRQAADHAAFERETLRALAAAGPTTGRGQLAVDRASLRRALGGRDEVLEAMAAAKASGRPGANASVMWRYFTTSVYQSGDLPVLATREALQNSVDANKAAVRARKTKAGAGRFAVSWDSARRALTWEDNGIGMDTETILSKFLTIGESGKSSAGDSEEAAGGFGVAKAVILGASSTFRWEMHTRDNLAVSEGIDQDVQVFDAPFLQGTRITIFDVAEEFDETWDYARQSSVSLPDRLRGLLAGNDLRGIELILDGEPVGPMFSRRAGSQVKLDGSWGRGTTAAVKAYRRPPGDRRGAYYLRLGGLYQFRTPSQRGNLKADVVVDLLTDVRPGGRGYPFNAARDALQDRARWAFNDLVEEVERENESVGRSLEDEVFDPDSEHDAERRGAQELADLAAEAFADADFQRALADAAGGIADFYAERAKDPGVQQPTASAAPPGSKARRSEDTPARAPVLPPGIRVLAAPVAGDIASPSPTDAVRRLRALLQASDEAVELAGGDTTNPVVSSWVERALDRAEAGEPLDEHDVAALEGAVGRAGETALGAGGGGLVQAATVAQLGELVLGSLQATEAGEKRRKRKRNPFGRLAGLRISKRNYDRGRARRFKKGFHRWIAHLTAWDAALRLVAAEARIRRRFKPGFVLDDELIGLTTSTASGTSVVYLHPDRFAQVVKAHGQRPLAIAAFLHGVACHELTHLDGRMGDGHSEEFVAAREDLGHATGHLLPAIAVLVAKVLGLKLKPSEEQKQLSKMERQLEAARAKAKGSKRAQADVARLEAEMEQARAELAEALEQSAEMRVSCGHACPTCTGGTAAAWSTPGTRLQGSTLGEWVAAWTTLEARPASGARHAALEAHIDFLPEAVVVAADSQALDALGGILRAARPPRGSRKDHASTRLLDAIDRRRQALGAPAGRDRASRVLDAATAVLRAQPPAGVDVDYLDAFVHRHRDHLQGLVRGALERRAAGAAR